MPMHTPTTYPPFYTVFFRVQPRGWGGRVSSRKLFGWRSELPGKPMQSCIVTIWARMTLPG